MSRQEAQEWAILCPCQTREVKLVLARQWLLSAIKDQLKVQGKPIPADVKAAFEEYLGGYDKRMCASLKQSGEMAILKGKLALRFEAYGCTALLRHPRRNGT